VIIVARDIGKRQGMWDKGTGRDEDHQCHSARRANKPNSNPYTICIIANPFFESPANSGSLFVDPISHSEQLFNSKVSYILSALFGQLPNQAETMLSPISHEFRVISIFDDELQSADQNALVSEQDDLVVARQLNFASFLATYQAGLQQQIKADVAFAVTAANNSRSSGGSSRCPRLINI
jgi:hypothetical protein